MSIFRVAVIAVFVWTGSSIGLSSSASASEWPEFRGPAGEGHAPSGSDPPLQWDESRNVVWKTLIHDRGWSSPVVCGTQVWMTTATEDGKAMYLVAVDVRTGEILHDIHLFHNEKPRFRHPTNSYASPTPVLWQGRVFAHFGSYGTACVDASTGKVLWQRRDLPCNHWRGPGSSPIVHDGLVFFPMDGFDVQYMIALDADTGETVWKKDRNIRYASTNGDHMKGYATCRVIQWHGQEQLISPSAAETIAYEPRTGREIWRVRHGGMNAATRPIFGQGLLFLTNGDPVGREGATLLAVRPPDAGQDRASIVWSETRNAPRRPSPLLVEDHLYVVSDDGIAACLRASDGEIVWRKRLGGKFRASPVFAAGRIYFSNLEGQTFVIQAAPQFTLLAENELEAGCQASPAIIGDALIVRTITHLYRVESSR